MLANVTFSAVTVGGWLGGALPSPLREDLGTRYSQESDPCWGSVHSPWDDRVVSHALGRDGRGFCTLWGSVTQTAGGLNTCVCRGVTGGSV